jgi:hypothetical protein
LAAHVWLSIDPIAQTAPDVRKQEDRSGIDAVQKPGVPRNVRSLDSGSQESLDQVRQKRKYHTEAD